MAPNHSGSPDRSPGLDDDRTIRERLYLFEHAARVAKLCVYGYDPITKERRWSDDALSVLGLPPGTPPITDADVLKLVHADDALRLQALTLAARADPTMIDTTEEFRIVGRDGGVRHVQLIVHFDPDENGDLLGTQGALIDITDRRELEKSAAADELRFRMAADAAGMGVFERDHRTGVGKWSDRLWAIYGMEPRAEALSQAEFQAMIHPDDVAVRQRQADRLRDAPEYTVSNFNYRIIRKDGEIRHLVVRSMPERDPDGRLGMARGVVYDNTEHVVAEQAARATEARFHNAIEAVGLGVFALDVTTGRGTWSARTWEIFGLPQRDDAPGYDEVDLYVHPDDRKARRQEIEQSQSGSKNVGNIISYRIIRPDGAVRHVERSEAYERDRDGRIRVVQGVLNDVTERVVAEEAVRESEARFRNAAAAADLGVFERNPLSGKAFWSTRMWEILGLVPRASPPTREEFLTFVHPDDRARYVTVRDDVIAGSVRQAGCEMRMVRPDATIRHVSIHLLAAPVDATGDVHMYGFMADLTADHALRRQAQISASLSTLGSMASGIAHDLAQPLSSIGLSAAMLEAWIEQGGSVGGSGAATRAVARIQQQVDRAGQTIRHLLKLARGGQSTGIATLSDVVTGSLELIGTTLNGAGIKLDIAIPDDLPPVQGAQIALEQVLINLLLNARDAMRATAERKITLRAVRHDNTVVFDIEDTGGGIASEHLPHLFEPLFTTKKEGEGTGLGLPICRNIMEACGGGISVANGVTGARFTLRFLVAVQGAY